MKRWGYLAAATVVLALVAAAVYWFYFSRPEQFVHRDLVAGRVDTLPNIDGLASDSAWQSATSLRGKTVSLRAVHDGRRIAFLVEWDDPTLSLNTAGAWQLTGEGWRRNRRLVEWESFNGKRHPEWLGIFWPIRFPGFARKGCTSTCHKKTGNHHMVESPGQRVDAWHVLAKHGWGKDFLEDQGWLLGGTSCEQRGRPTFGHDAMDPAQPVAGDYAFAGFAEDAALFYPGDKDLADPAKPAVQYCTQCHKKKLRIAGDAGAIPYEDNWNDDGTGPRYLEVAPADFLDAMVLTRGEVDSGEAIAATPAGPATKAAWRRYRVLGATVPQLILKEPSGSAGDLRVAARWHDGRWVVELERRLVTRHPDDVQFNNLGKEYPFAVSLWDKKDLAKEYQFMPLMLNFAR